MRHSGIVFNTLLVLLAIVPASASNSGSPSLGWITIIGSEQVIYTDQGPIYDSGYVIAQVNGYQVEYDYSQGDTLESVTAGLAAAFNSPSSPVTASVSGGVVSLTSKVTGSASNTSLVAIYGTFDPNDFSPSFTTGTVGMIGGRDGPRNFPMIMYFDNTTADADLASMILPEQVQQLPGDSILAMLQSDWFPSGSSQAWLAFVLSQQHYDLSRIDAVNVDEPYVSLFNFQGLPTTGDPCALNDTRRSVILQVYGQLQAAANIIKTTSPRTRFWINFSAGEVGWMRNGSCAFLNAPYIDVVSEDHYLVDFLTTVKPDYDWFIAHPSHLGQQIALVPGTFLHSSGDPVDPVAQASLLEEYFDYASSLNSSCTQPLGSNGATGMFDGCPVWTVAGYLFDNHASAVGLSDQSTAPIQAAWQAELSTPLLPNFTAARSVHQFWSDGSGIWHDQNLTGSFGGALAVSGSAFSSFNAFTSERNVFFESTDYHVHHFWSDSSSNWHDQDLTGLFGGALAAGRSALSSFVVDSSGEHNVFFQSVDQHVHHFWSDSSGNWHDQDLTSLSGGATAVFAGALSSFNAFTSEHNVFFESVDQHVHHLWSDSSGNWHDQDLTGLVGGTVAASATTLSSFVVSSSGEHDVFFESADQHIHNFWSDSSGNWHDQDLTGLFGGTLATPGSALTSFSAFANEHNVFFESVDQHVHHFWSDSSGNWHDQDLTGGFSGTPAFLGSALSSFVVNSSGEHNAFFESADQHVHHFWSDSSGNWHDQDLTGGFSGTPVAYESPLSSFLLLSTGEHDVFFLVLN